MTYWLTLTSLPSVVLGHLVGVLSLALGLSHDPHYRNGILTTTWRPRFARVWRYSTTVGFFVGMHPHPDATRTWAHEMVHVKQMEDHNLLGAIIGGLCCIVSWRLGLIVWATSGAVWLLPNYFTGWVRTGDAYLGSEHELSAYAQTGPDR